MTPVDERLSKLEQFEREIKIVLVGDPDDPVKEKGIWDRLLILEDQMQKVLKILDK